MSQFTLDGLTMYDGTATDQMWNGFQCPKFTRMTAERILNDQGLPYRFDGDILLVDDGYGFDEALTVVPDAQGLYALGAFSWTWDHAA